MKITRMRANHLETPLGYDLSGLSLSWIPEGGKTGGRPGAGGP